MGVEDDAGGVSATAGGACGASAMVQHWATTCGSSARDPQPTQGPRTRQPYAERKACHRTMCTANAHAQIRASTRLSEPLAAQTHQRIVARTVWQSRTTGGRAIGSPPATRYDFPRLPNVIAYFIITYRVFKVLFFLECCTRFFKRDARAPEQPAR